jgi:PD-(D/E)XK nuclease superfamily
MRYEGPHWSATQFMVYDQCPAEYRRRYVEGVAFEPTEATAFGQAIHQGLEAHFGGQDGEQLFRAVWKSEAAKLGGQVHRSLTAVGLELLDKVFALDLRGTAERPFVLRTDLILGKPIVGAIDLWGDDGTIYDFKTTRGRWSQDRAQTELWQPVLYAWVGLEETGVVPDFEYIVLNRVTGQLDRFRRRWLDEEAWAAQWCSAYDRMRTISAAVAADELDCHGKHGYCPECGARWSHEHVCEEPTSRRLQLVNPERAGS